MKPGPKPGYKQTAEHKAAVNAALGEHRGNWRGDNASQRTGRTRAERLYRDIGPCSHCGDAKAERHHKDGNTLNNTPENIAILCRRCHMEEDGRMASLPELWAIPKKRRGEA